MLFKLSKNGQGLSFRSLEASASNGPGYNFGSDLDLAQPG